MGQRRSPFSYTARMRQHPTLTTKLMATGCAFLFLAMVSIGLTLWVTWKLEGGAAAVNEAGRLRMYTVRMALALETQDSARLQTLAKDFDDSLELLRSGTAMRPLFVPWSDDVRARFDDIRTEWAGLREAWTAPRKPASMQPRQRSKWHTLNLRLTAPSPRSMSNPATVFLRAAWLSGWMT